MFSTLIIGIFVSALLQLVTADTTNITGYSISSLFTMVPSVTYLYNLTTNNSIPQSSAISVTFSNNFLITNSTLSGCMASLDSSQAMTTLTGTNNCYATYSSSSNTYSVNMATAFPTNSANNYTYIGMQFIINNPIGVSPSGGNTQAINIAITAPNGTQIIYVQSSVKYTASSLTSCSMSGISSTVGASTTTTFSFTTSQPVLSGSTILVTAPSWSVGNYSNFASSITCTNNLGASSASCSNSTSSGTLPRPITGQLISTSNIFTSNLTSATLVTFGVSPMKNPPSTAPNGPFLVQIIYGVNNYVSQNCSTIYETVSTPNPFSITYNLGKVISGNSSTIKLVFKNPNPIPIGGYMHLNFPTSVNITYSGTTYTLLTQNSTDITIALAPSTNILTNTSFTIGNFNVTYPPSTASYVITFSTEYVSGSTIYYIDRNTITYTNNAGVISSCTVSALSYLVGATTTYTIIFTTINNLIANSYVTIQFPSAITLQGISSCTPNVSFTSCLVISNNVTFILSASLSGGSQITITVTNAVNYYSAITSTSFTIYTYYTSSNDLVDNLLSGITTTFLASPITTASIVPVLAKVGASTTYNFSITLPNTLVQNGWFSVIFPIQVVCSNSPTLTILSSSMESTCVATNTSGTITFTNCFNISNHSSSIPLSFQLSLITNPTSAKPSSSFTIYTYDSLGNQINYYNSTLLTVTMSIAASMTALISTNTSVVHTNAVYTFTLSFSQTHTSGDIVIITFPSGLLAPSSPTCSAITNLNSAVCVPSANLSTISVTMTFTTAPTSVVFSISAILNYDVATNLYLSFQTTTSTGYFIESVSSIGVTFTLGALTTSINNDFNIAVLQSSNLTLTITNAFVLNSLLATSNTYLYVILPASFTIGSSCTTSNSASCTVTNSTSYMISQVGNLSNYIVTLPSVILPYFSTTSSAITINYMYSTNFISQGSITISVYCTSPCQQCSINKTYCITCLPQTYVSTYLFYNNTCLSTCPSGYYNSSNICTACISPCTICTTSTNCSMCTSGYWVSPTNTCGTTCPSTYYNDSSGLCKSCSLGSCYTCSSLVICLSCSGSLFLNSATQTCVVASSCASGTYAAVSNNTCSSCTSPCSTCNSSATNCTSCISAQYLLSNICYTSCPSTYYNDNSSGLCQSCVSPCQTCNTTSTNCSTCLNGFYYNTTNCVTASNCPSGTYANSTNNNCSACISPCSTCSSNSTCLSCVSNKWLYSGSCSSTCPSGYYNDSSLVCLSCTNNCSTCSSISTCLSCSSPYFLSTTICVTSSNCPSGTYANSTNNNCSTCVSPCATCSSTSTCLSCVSNKWLSSGSCLSTCPSGFYNDSSLVCLACTNNCSTCSSNTTCLSCASPYFLSASTCVTSNNCPSGTYANSTNNNCSTCVSPCATCSSMTTCSSCISNKWLSSGSCLSTCPSGFYNDSSLVCLACTNNCSTCSSNTTCLSCASPYYIYGSTCVTSSSCPTGTYPNLSNNSCTACTNNCSSCSGSATNCQGCTSGTFLLNNVCYSTCPSNYFSNISICSICISPCQTCTSNSSCVSCLNNYFLTGTNCVLSTSCPTGTFANSNNNTCTSCTTPCSTCNISAANCTSCAPYYYISFSSCLPCSAPCSTCTSATVCTTCNATSGYVYNGGCTTTCPTGYYGDGVSGQCLQLVCQSTCLTCTSPSNCTICNSGYYMYSGYCYLSCPLQAPIANGNYTCSACDTGCLSCNVYSYNCTSCQNNLYLWRYQCVSSCPAGLVSIVYSGSCVEPLIGNIIFFPNLIILTAFTLVMWYSKHRFVESEFVTGVTSMAGLLEFISWNIFTYTLLYDTNSAYKYTYFYIGIIITIISMLVGISFLNFMLRHFQPQDEGFKLWEQLDFHNKRSHTAVMFFSFFTYRFHRFIYCKILNQVWANCFFTQAETFLLTIKRLGYFSMIANTLPMLINAAICTYNKQIKDQVYYCAIEVIIFAVLNIILLFIDAQKDIKQFELSRIQLGIASNYLDLSQDSSGIIEEKIKRRNSADFKQFRNSWEREIYQNRRRVKSCCDNDKEREKIFRAIKFIDVNKFGHLNVLEEPAEQKEKSLPEYGQLYKLGLENKDKKLAEREKKRKMLEELDQVRLQQDEKQKQQKLKKLRQDQLKFQQQQRQRLQKEKQEAELREKLRLEDQERLKQLQIQNEKRRIQQEKERERLRKEEEDALQQVDVTFFDKMVLNKELGMLEKGEQSPLNLLKKFKSAKQKQIDEKQLKKLDEMAAQYGLNKEFLRKTFGKDKFYNPDLLKKFLGKYSHFPKQLAQKIFNENNDPEILQQLFGKEGNADPERIKQLFQKQPFDEVLFNRLFSNKQALSSELTKSILEQDSKIHPDFTSKVLSNDSVIHPQKIEGIFAKEQVKNDIQKMVKVVGERAQNEEVMNNMMSESSLLDHERMSPVLNSFKPQILKNLFGKKDQVTDRIVTDLLNDTTIDPKTLSKILKNQDSINNLAKILSSGDKISIQNLKRFIKESPNLDPKLVQQLLTKPALLEKLFKIPYDPMLLNKLFAKDSNIDLQMLEQVIMNTDDKNLKHMFEFSPENKNINFDAVKVLFEKDKKSDPKLIIKMFQNPELFVDLFTKGNNDPQILKKLVEKGRQFDADMVQKLYGKQKNPFFVANFDFKQNLKRNEDVDFRSLKNENDLSNKQKNQILNMSRTQGINFLKPRSFMKNLQQMNSETNLNNHDQLSQEEEEEDDGEEIIENIKRREKNNSTRKKKLPKIKPKKVTDIRLDAEGIYLQRLGIPGEKKTQSIRKKRTKKNQKGIMDEDNDVLDLDF